MGLLNALKGVLVSKRGSTINVAKRFRLMPKRIAGSASMFYFVEELATEKRMGLKILNAAKTELFRNRFKDLKLPLEGEIAVKIQHKNVVETYDYGRTEKGESFLLMELLEGSRLDDAIERQLFKSLKQKLKVIMQMANAVQAVHDANFIHRDVCPRNFVFNKEHSRLKLIDFGLTVPNQTEFRQPRNRTGTPLYMAPEIVRRRATSHRVDVFAFGVTAFEVLAGVHPWDVTENTSKSALLFDTRAPQDICDLVPKLPRKIGRLITDCLEVDVDKRMASCEAFLRKLKIATS